MSLLIDALRKAEQQQGPGTSAGRHPPRPDAGAVDTLSLEPLPDLPHRLEELDAQFFAAEPTLREGAVDGKRRTGQSTTENAAVYRPSPAAAQNLFSAKAAPALPRPGFALTAGIAALVAAAIIGGYFVYSYWQLQPRGGSGIAPRILSPLPPAAPATAVAVVPSLAPAQTAAPPPALALPATPAADGASPPTAQAGTAKKAATLPPSPGKTDPPHQPAATAVPPSAAIDPTLPHFRRSTGMQNPPSAPATATAAFNRGDIETARMLWQRILRVDPHALPAVHGLAAIAQREGRPEEAAAYYRRALEIDPKDAQAHAGLLALQPPADPQQAESRLKTLLAEQPDSPPLNFALGNLLAGAARWAEAQSAYFKAHVADPANPDYLYNLAVSLDHLHQVGLAAQYYARALAATANQPAAFDPQQAKARMQTLTPGQPR